MIKILKKNGQQQAFNGQKIRRAIQKSAQRVCVTLTQKDQNKVISTVKNQLKFNEVAVPVSTIHNLVEVALDSINSNVAKSYREYRDNKAQFASMLDKVYSKKLSLNFIGDRSNANSDSALVTTQKAIVYNQLNSELYKKFFLTQAQERAMSDGYIYIHDRGSRLDTMNCCIYDMKNLIKGGFFMGNLDYKEPKSLDVAFDLIGDVTLNAASFQYGGFTIPQVDKLLAPYAQKSYKIYYNDYMRCRQIDDPETAPDQIKEKADKFAYQKVKRQYQQGFQSWQMKFNSVASSRGDYPFTALTFGLGKSRFQSLASSIVMKVRKEGQGLDGKKHPVLFPKLSFFYDQNLHGQGKELQWLFDQAIDCSSKSMYPDFISLTGDGYAPRIYKKYGIPISRMGCIDYAQKVVVSNHKSGDSSRELMIGQLFKSIEDGRGFNYASNKVQRIVDSIKDPENKAKFAANGYIWCDGQLMNQWAEDFRSSYRRKPTRGDVKEFFGYDLHRKSIRASRKIDSSLFDLWDSWLQLKTVDQLKRNGFIQRSFQSQCQSDKDFLRNKVWRENGTAKQIDIYFPKLKIGFEVQDFATHSRVDDQPYQINGKTRDDYQFKKGPKYSEQKKRYFKDLGIDVHQIWQDEIRNKNFSVLSSNLSYQPTQSKPNVKVVEVNTQQVRCFDLEAIGLRRFIKDIDGSFVRIKKIMKNKDVTDWLSIELESGRQLLVTSDHPLITPDGQTLASQLKVGEHLVLESEQLIRIAKITQLNRVANSYDVQTQSGTFVFSGVQSHNCRAQTSPWFVRGGMEPADEDDVPVYEGRFNMGAISLHFSMIAAKARKEGKDFYEVLDYYLDMARRIHKRTFEYLSHKKAGINPLGFCQGGFYNGHKDPDEELGEDFLRPMTMSFGIMGLNEASVYQTGKAIHEDNTWAIAVLKHINQYADKYKKIDGILWAIYGTPGQSLCHTQIQQFRSKFGIIKGVSDHEYTTNSFHCPVYADITPIQKQDIEYPMFHLCNGGNIQYVRYRAQYNIQSIKTLVRRAMKMGFYEGVNFQLDWCQDCGYSFIDSDTCPKCGSTHITRIQRMNGYLSYSSVRGKTMYADHKLQQFKQRKSM